MGRHRITYIDFEPKREPYKVSDDEGGTLVVDSSPRTSLVPRAQVLEAVRAVLDMFGNERDGTIDSRTVAAFRMQLFEGLTEREIAVKLKLSEESISCRLRRLKNRLPDQELAELFFRR